MLMYIQKCITEFIAITVTRGELSVTVVIRTEHIASTYKFFRQTVYVMDNKKK